MENNFKYKQILTMVGLTFFTQVIIFAISALTASRFGVNIEIDSFNLSKNISNFIFGLIGTGIITVVIPELSKNCVLNKSINIFITFIYSGLALVFIITFIYKKGLIILLVGNSNSELISLSQKVLNILMISYYFLSINSLIIAIHQVKDKFNYPKVVQLLSSIIVFFLLLKYKNISIIKYTFIISLGNIINFIFLYYSYKKIKYKFEFNLDFKEQGFQLMLRNLFPILFAAGVYQLSLLVDTTLASRLGEGNISILSYSTSIVGMINGLFIGNLVTYIYPKLSKLIHEKKENANQLFYNYSIFATATIVLIVLGFYLVGKEFLTLLFQRGNFTEKNTSVVYEMICLYLISMPFYAIRDISYRYFYANNDTKKPFINSLKTTAINIFISVLFAYYIGLKGIVLGTTISSIMSNFMIYIEIKKEYQLDIYLYRWKELVFIILNAIITFIIIKMIMKILIFSIVYKILIISILATLLYCTPFYILKSKLFQLK